MSRELTPQQQAKREQAKETLLDVLSDIANGFPGTLSDAEKHALETVTCGAFAHMSEGVFERHEELAFLHLSGWSDEEIAEDMARFV